jgi:hypothetical protein
VANATDKGYTSTNRTRAGGGAIIWKNQSFSSKSGALDLCDAYNQLWVKSMKKLKDTPKASLLAVIEK